jgi:hypothetical protein
MDRRGFIGDGMARVDSMKSVTIRVSRATHELLRVLAARMNATIMAVVDAAARDLQTKRFWEDFNASCEALKADPVAWADLQREDAVWETICADGLEKQSHGRSDERRRTGPR